MRPYIYMMGYGLFQTLVWMIVAYLSQSLPVTVMFLFRNLIGFLISVTGQPASQFNWQTFRRWRIHLLRASATLFGGLSIFYSVSRIPVADSVAITFLAPIFGSLLSVGFLGEKLTRGIVLKLIGGFVGVYIITGFSAEGDWLGYLGSILGAMMTGLAYVSVKSLSTTEEPRDILYVSYLLMIPVAALLSWHHWVAPSLAELIGLLGIGVAFYFSQLLMAKAFALAPASKVLPADYSRIIFSSALGWLFLQQEFTFHTLLGSLVILVVSLIGDPK